MNLKVGKSLDDLFPTELTQRGYIYKQNILNFNEITNDEIIYIPHIAFTHHGKPRNQDELIHTANLIYTKDDFQEIAEKEFQGEKAQSVALWLFKNVDWQLSEALLGSTDFNEQTEACNYLPF